MILDALKKNDNCKKRMNQELNLLVGKTTFEKDGTVNNNWET